MRRPALFAFILLGASSTALGQTAGNHSVLARPLNDLGPINGGVAFAYEFVVEAGAGNHTVDQVGFYQAFYDDAGGNDRNYRIGFQQGTGAGPNGTWLASTTFTHCCAPGELWYAYPLAATLAGGATYFLVLEATDAGPDNIIHLASSSPAVGRVPQDQKVSTRRLWKRTSGTWAVLAGHEPIFHVRYTEADPNAAAGCATTPRLEGNVYTHLASLPASSATGAFQTFTVGQAIQANKVELPLTAVAGSGNLDLEVYDVAAGAVMATVPLTATAATLAGGTVYEAVLPNLVFQRSVTPGQFTYRLGLKPAGTRTASWQAVSSAAATPPTDVCTEFARATFGGGRGVASVGATVRSEQDGIFRLTACTPSIWYRDSDGDGHGAASLTQSACVQPSGYVANSTDCDDTDAQRKPGLAEACDGKDNDCSGATDDALAAPACSLTVGVCAGFTKTCGGAAGWQDCAGYGADYEAGAETACDGLDNDCDGTTDGALARPACAKTLGVCSGTQMTCGGAAGWIACTASDYGAEYEPAESRCDGKDNDCDGATDQGLTAPACALASGVCAGRSQVCGGAAGWLACGASEYGTDYEAAEARCDGKDNDCDGATDEGLTAPACALLSGVCAGKTRTCGGAGGWLACTADDYGADFEAGAETRCDGLDNDCDGATDETLAAPACSKALGVCAGTAKTCGGAGGWADCAVADYGPDYEEVESDCDGKDNDCDGVVDDLPAAPACPEQVGVCQGSVQKCDGAGGWQPCDATRYGVDYEAAETRCDGLDNDCDAATDEDLQRPACSRTLGACAAAKKICDGANGWKDCAAGDYGPDFEDAETRCDGQDNDCNGVTDDVAGAPDCPEQDGACLGSRQRCDGAGGWLPCDAAAYGADYEAAETRCDGQDNDCDGVTDGGLAAPDCARDEGVCAGAKQRCGGASGWLTCGPADYGDLYEDVEVSCDGQDNDCNGTTDDVSGGCACVPGVTAPRPCGSDVGECASGTEECVAADTWGPCSGAQGPGNEECNGLDDDCDGETDEGLAAHACSNQVGVCAGSVAQCQGKAGWAACDAARYGTDYQSVETRCDGKDNDCDGVTDPGQRCGPVVYDLGGCGCGASSDGPLLLVLAALAPLRALRRRRR